MIVHSDTVYDTLILVYTNLLFFLPHTRMDTTMTDTMTSSTTTDGPTMTPIKASLDRMEGGGVVAEGREKISTSSL